VNNDKTGETISPSTVYLSTVVLRVMNDCPTQQLLLKWAVYAGC